MFDKEIQACSVWLADYHSEGREFVPRPGHILLSDRLFMK